jgi:hypothetical protein
MLAQLTDTILRYLEFGLGGDFIENISILTKLKIPSFMAVRSSESCFDGLSGDLRLLTNQAFPKWPHMPVFRLHRLSSETNPSFSQPLQIFS